MFEFVKYSFNKTDFTANFEYRDLNGVLYTERVAFSKNIGYDDSISELLDKALKLCFLLIGTSYYKCHPTNEVKISFPIDKFQSEFLNLAYNEGLSQYAYENNLTRKNLAKFVYDTDNVDGAVKLPYKTGGILSLQSGGKDSILTAELLNERGHKWSAVHIGSSDFYPSVLDKLGVSLEKITRLIDIGSIKKSESYPSYKNGHVPVTYILMSISLVQAILDRKNIVLTSIGREGEEPHSIIRDPSGNLAVNHQWSKTYTAEKWFAEYVHRYICPDIQVGSLIRGYSELKIAELFASKCWKKYGHSFSSCNVANYRQKNNNSYLTWCSDCAKCANSYLIFAPFIDSNELIDVFGVDLFTRESLADVFRGLLGVSGYGKPFECVGEINELRQAYEMRRDGYGSLPFDVPKNVGFDYNKTYEMQRFAIDLLKV